MRDEIVITDKTERDLVCVVQALVADLAVQVGDLLDGPLVVGGALVATPTPTREAGEGALGGFEFRGGLAGAPGVGDALCPGVSN